MSYRAEILLQSYSVVLQTGLDILCRILQEVRVQEEMRAEEQAL